VAVALFVLVTSAAGTAVAYQQTSAEPDTATGSAAIAMQDAGAGSAVYDANCASCHQAGGVGVPGTFPPLAGNPNAADPAHVEQVIREGLSGPIDVNGDTYDGVMPALPKLSDTEIADVTAYVVGLAEGGATEPTGPPPAPAEDGTVSGGEAIFTGSTGLTNGGGACVGCHTAGSVGNLGGPAFGPDLTDVASRLGGEAGLSGWLANPPSPTMMPIFAERPLTPEEIADITAFLVDAPDQKAPSQSVDWLLVAAGAGFLVLIAGMAIAYRGMRQTYKDRLTAQTSARGGTRARTGTPGAVAPEATNRSR
jgi:mono/diheme cytochrome c family protein